MAISNAKAIIGLTATGGLTRTGVSGSGTLGKTQTRTTLTAADIFYSFTITSTGSSDVATLTLSTGVVAQTTGTPTITDGAGNDFEGKTNSTLVSLSGVLVEYDETGTGSIAQAGSVAGLVDHTATIDGTTSQLTIPAGETLSGTIAFTFDEVGQQVTLHLAGKTT